MNEYVGEKIKGFATVIGWVLLIAGIIGFICFAVEDRVLIGLISLCVGIVGFLSSWILYAFGQLVDDISDISYCIKEIEKRHK